MNSENVFGSDHTEEKLRYVAKYMKAYTTALKKRKFKLMYIDAFAGTGYRSQPTGAGNDAQENMFAGVSDSDSENLKVLLKGSARLALEVDPPFERYVFIEANKGRFDGLTQLAQDVPRLASRIEFIHGDANVEVTRICKETVWGNQTRALVFLDPFGAQVEWKTVETIARTEAIDLWYLFPLMAVVRMTPKDGRIPEAWANRLDKMLGDPNWREAFYTQDSEPDLFGDRALQKTTQVENVERYLLARLKSVFAGVANKTLRLPEAEGRTMFLLVFACANPAPKAVGLALKIANDILGR